MTRELLDRITAFAHANMNRNDDNPSVYFEHNGMAITNPWIDESARFPLDDIGAVKEYGLENVIDFCEKARKEMEL